MMLARSALPCSFDLLKTDTHTGARAGVLHTPHGDVPTPVYMPVGTQATVKTLTPDELSAAGASLILANTYHLSLRPGAERIGRHGGLHRFMGWEGPILTDSGGFQVFSLGALRKITEEGVHFASPINGDRLFLTPEEAMRIQQVLNSDIAMAFDECTSYPATEAEARHSMELSMRWAARSKTARQVANAVLGIVQGGGYPQLRPQSVEQLLATGFEPY